MFIFCAIVCSYYSRNIAPAILILLPIIILTVLMFINGMDMNKAYVEIDGDIIKVVDYYFGIKKEKQFREQDIYRADIILGYSMRVHGYRWSHMGTRYIVFRDKSNRYLFKVIFVPETKQFFKKYIQAVTATL